MKNHKKYAKLPQDLDLSYSNEHLDVDTAVTAANSDVDFNLTGSGLDEDDDNILDDHDEVDDDDLIDDEEEDEIVIATAAASAGLSSSIGGGGGVRLAAASAAARKQQLNRKVLAGLGRDSVIEVSASLILFRAKIFCAIIDMQSVRKTKCSIIKLLRAYFKQFYL